RIQNMKKILFACCFLLFYPFSSDAGNLSVDEAFKKIFPQHKFESISPTSIKGVYEVYTGNQIYYFMPEAEVVITGNIITKDGVNLTRESNSKKMAAKMAKLPLESALKIGKGKTTVIEFTDPNCPYCRQAFQYFAARKDVTVYVFLIPLSHDSERKIRHIICSENKVKTYEDVMSGKLDKNAPLNICNDKKADDMIKTHRELASQAGIRATPTFHLKGNAIDGFEKDIIDNLLNQ
ncbi:MAG TPA: DsbC family protein, partial [Smithellaceae bacterium]|nr:DsbC family protein [Smithellaceae bacterium]